MQQKYVIIIYYDVNLSTAESRGTRDNDTRLTKNNDDAFLTSFKGEN